MVPFLLLPPPPLLFFLRDFPLVLSGKAKDRHLASRKAGKRDKIGGLNWVADLLIAT